MTPQEKKDLATATLRACLGQDFERARPNLAEDVRWIIPKSMTPALGQVTGREAFLKACSVLGPVFPDGLSLAIRHVHCDGETVLIEYGCQGTTANGKLYDNDYCTAFVIQGGKVRIIREYADSKHAAEVMFS